MKILYFDCFAGISGDMAVGALLDLGVPLDLIREGIGGLPLSPTSFSLELDRVERRGMTAAKFRTGAKEEHGHRHYSDIAQMIEASSISPGARGKAQRVLRRLAEAEARVHGVALEMVHFHEVGAVDSIIDIVAAAIAIDHLNVDEIHVAPLPLGGGFIDTAHGRLPVPAPATAELLRGLPVHGGIGSGERVTPTGAAIVAALGDHFGPCPAMTIAAIGCGAGDRDFPDCPNILRVFQGEMSLASLSDEVTVIETNIDDMNPEILAYAMERLFAAGALDVSCSPLLMKKGRQGSRVTVIAEPAAQERLARLLLHETTAIGVRFHGARRLKLDRQMEGRETSLGRVAVKVIREAGKVVRVAPEYEECRRLAAENGLTLLEVYRLIESETGVR